METGGGLTVAEYLRRERAASTKSEFRDGRMIAMAGASRAHNRIVANLLRILGNGLLNSPCDLYAQDMKTQTAPGRFAYPDVVVVCGEPEFLDDETDVVTNPTVIVEVLSPSTEGYDRGDKFLDYQLRESLREYVLIAQDRVRIERFVRQDGGLWLYERIDDPAATLALSSVNCSFPVGDIYYRVETRDESG